MLIYIILYYNNIIIALKERYSLGSNPGLYLKKTNASCTGVHSSFCDFPSMIYWNLKQPPLKLLLSRSFTIPMKKVHKPLDIRKTIGQTLLKVGHDGRDLAPPQGITRLIYNSNKTKNYGLLPKEWGWSPEYKNLWRNIDHLRLDFQKLWHPLWASASTHTHGTHSQACTYILKKIKDKTKT